MKWEVPSPTEKKVGDTPAITKSIVGHVDNSRCRQINVDIQLTLTTPAEASGPVPVMMEFGFGGSSPGRGQARKGAAPKAMPKAGPPAGFGGGGPSWQEQVLAKGWGYAIIVPNSIQADNGAGLTEGIIGLCNKGQARKPDDWGALRAWAWGASRRLDYFETDKAVDAKQVGIEGLSRYGKAALVAMAYDERVRDRLHRLFGRGGGKAAPPQLRRAGREPHRIGRIPLDGRELSQVRRANDAGRPAGRCPRADCPVRPAADVHQLRCLDRPGG